MTSTHDIAIIGAGMAGASLAAALAPRGLRVVLVEAEAMPGYHATGRSAAFWTESYGGPGVQPLTTASGPWLRSRGFLKPRGALTIARDGDEAALEAFAARYRALGVRVELLARDALEVLVPGLRDGWTLGALEPDCCDIDVAGLHQHYLAAARTGGAKLHCGAPLAAAARNRAGWELTLATGETLRAGVIANAAGAWADQVAQLAGARPLGIAPFRRTVAQVRTRPAVAETLPLVLDLRETFYFKPESGRLWLSPHDETPSPPCDAAPEEIDIAAAVARLESVVDWEVQHIEHKWAGLRSFAPDRLPVFGYDSRVPGLFWFAGQGGFGIQTAPAAADHAARLVCGEIRGEVDPAPYLPGRFA